VPDSRSSRERSPIDALAAGSATLIGRYSYDGDSWTWSDTMFRMHGFEVGEIVPTGELMVTHLDPADVNTAQDDFKRALLSGEPYASFHHLIDNAGKRRTVLVAGTGTLDADERVVALHGYMIDLTEATAADRREEVEAAIAGVTQHRAVIEQAKGILMLAFGVESEEAFEVLRVHSQDNNIKLHELAGRLVDAVAGDEGLAEGSTRVKLLRVLDELT
jgi:hypothetical protein